MKGGRCTLQNKPGDNTDNVLRCITTASMLVEMQCNARIDSDPILSFLCVAFLYQIVKKNAKIFNLKCLRFVKLTQCKMLRCIVNRCHSVFAPAHEFVPGEFIR